MYVQYKVNVSENTGGLFSRYVGVIRSSCYTTRCSCSTYHLVRTYNVERRCSRSARGKGNVGSRGPKGEQGEREFQK